jgi:hypothetical protein
MTTTPEWPTWPNTDKPIMPGDKFTFPGGRGRVRAVVFDETGSLIWDTKGRDHRDHRSLDLMAIDDKPVITPEPEPAHDVTIRVTNREIRYLLDFVAEHTEPTKWAHVTILRNVYAALPADAVGQVLPFGQART